MLCNAGSACDSELYNPQIILNKSENPNSSVLAHSLIPTGRILVFVELLHILHMMAIFAKHEVTKGIVHLVNFVFYPVIDCAEKSNCDKVPLFLEINFASSPIILLNGNSTNDTYHNTGVNLVHCLP